MSDSGEATWLPLADWINLASLTVTLLGVFAAPVLGLFGLWGATRAFGWAVLLLTGWPLAVAGHYELFHRRPRTRPAPYVTHEEWAVVAIVTAASVAYWVVVVV